MYIFKLISEIKDWIFLYKKGKLHEEFLFENNIRRDWFGRLYTVINVPEDVPDNGYAIESYIIKNLRTYDEILIKLDGTLPEIVFPEFSQIPNEPRAYLLVLAVSNDYLNVLSLIKNFGIYFGILFILYHTYFYFFL